MAALDKLSAISPITGIKGDLSDSNTIKSAVRDFDIVVCAVPGFLAYETLKAVIAPNVEAQRRRK